MIVVKMVNLLIWVLLDKNLFLAYTSLCCQHLLQYNIIQPLILYIWMQVKANQYYGKYIGKIGVMKYARRAL